MKNFTKLLMSVVLLGAFSCTQDITEDQAPIISENGGGSGEVKTLQVSMPVSTRTELGEKVDGKYPVSWSEGDVLAVNGKPTTGISIYAETPSVAVFNLPLGITIPYHIVYPYQGENVAVEANSGKYPVVFSAEQKHTEGSFAPNSAPMYAWSNGFEDIHMEHLATALRFSIKAKDSRKIDLRYISVSTVDAAPIAGTFDVYCAEKDGVEAGTLEARESTYPTVFYSFEGDSYELSASKEDVFYIVVPKGEYERFEVNFVEQSGKVFSRTFDATGDKQLLGGKVREFPSVEFDLDDCSNMLLIGTDVDMQTFASAVKAGTFNTTYDGALLVSDIDMTGKAWESLNGFSSVFEGRGYAIKGLTTPLFGENVIGTISNVNVEGNLVETVNGKVGLVARSLTVSGDKVGTIFNCSAAGSIEYKNSTLAVSNDLKLINIGGVVGGVYGGKVSLADSDIDITISAIAGADGKSKSFTPCIGGVVGYVCADGDNIPLSVENTSKGDIVWNDESESIMAVPYIGGVAGYVTAGSFENNINSGELAINKPMDDLDWGGVIGASKVSVVNCENKGSLTINQQITKANIGGVVGLLSANSAVNCENSGKLLFNENFFINENCNIGGVVAYADKGTKKIENCSNSGSITYLGSCKYADRATINGNANIVIGGVVGFTWSELVDNCDNKQSAVLNIAGKISGNGDIKNNKATIDKNTAIGGVIGIRAGRKDVLGISENVTTVNCNNEGNVTFKWGYCGASYIFSSACIGIFESDYISDCSNAGSVTAEVNVTTDAKPHDETGTVTAFVSGMFGYISANCDQIYNCSNSGLVQVQNTNARMLWVSGLLGTAANGVNIKFNNCGNTGDILVHESVNLRNAYVGGILGNTLDIKLQYPNCYNSGSVETRAKTTGETYLGSIFGFSTGSDTGAGTIGITNSGRVTYAGNSGLAYVGGYCGVYKEKEHTVQFENASTGVVEFKGNATYGACVGGIAGVGGAPTYTSANGVISEWKSVTANEGGEFKNGMTNNGNVTIYGYAPKVYVSGGFGYLAAKNKGVSNLTNNGKVEVPDMTNAKNIPDSFYIGGVFGYATTTTAYPTTQGTITEAKAISNCHNKGDIIYKGIAKDGAYIGGLGGWASKAPIYNCTNDGKVTCEGHAGSLCPRFNEAGEKVAAHQYRNYHYHDIAVGGIVGETDLDMSGCVNNGEVTHNCLLNPLRVDYLGELATSRFDVGGIAGRIFTPEVNTTGYICSIDGVVNNGDVTIYGVPSATLCSPSADMEDNGEYQWTDIDDGDRQNRRLFTRVNVAGLIGRMMDLSHLSGGSGQTTEPSYYISGSTNNGKVSVPEAGGAKCLSVAGGVADILVSHSYFSGVHNKGRISIDNAGVGTTVDSKKMIHAFFINLGGIAATYFDYRFFGNEVGDFSKYSHHLEFDNCTNEGDIHYGEMGASVYQCAGGILGQVLHTAGDRCINLGMEGYGGGKWYKSQAQVKFSHCKNSGNIDYLSQAMNLSSHYNFNYAGGILGAGSMSTTKVDDNPIRQSFGNINIIADHCENTGNVQFDRSNGVISTNADPYYTAVGGIIGFYAGGIGHVTNSDTAVGGNLGTRENGCNAQIISCKNSGRIHGFSGIMGGIIGLGNWYVKITGTESDPTINTGDIAVMRENGKVVTRGRYGQKYTYAGGIAGVLREYHDARYAVASASSSTNNAYPDYAPEHMYCRVEHAVNEGNVGATGIAGGIAGYYWSAVQPSKRDGAVMSHRGGMENCRNTGNVYSLEQATTNVGAIVGMPRMFNYISNTGNDVAKYLSDSTWPLGVNNCEVGGYILRGATGEMTIDQTNYINAIYGEAWDSTFESTSEKDFDGCTFYAPAEETPEGNE